MNISTTRTGIKTRIDTISGFSQTFKYPPANATPPFAFVGTCRMNPLAALGGVANAEFDVWVAVSKVADSQNVGANVDAYMGDEGASSVDAAIQGDETLGGAVSTSTVTAAEGPIQFDAGGTAYEGARFTVAVYE